MSFNLPPLCGGFFMANHIKDPEFNIQKKYLLPLICAAAVLGKKNYFVRLLKAAKLRKLSAIKIYEGLLQNYLFAGYPSALVSLKTFKIIYPKFKLSGQCDFNLYHFKKNGEMNCKKIYGNKYDKLISNIKSFSPDMAEWLVLEGYGKVLSRKDLLLSERECCIVSVLTAMKFDDQLYSHINGAFRLGIKESSLRKIINNLSLIGERSSVRRGLMILDKYKSRRGR